MSSSALSRTNRGIDTPSAFASFKCNGSPLSVMTQRPAFGAEDEQAASRILVDHVHDLIAILHFAVEDDAIAPDRVLDADPSFVFVR